MSKQEVTFRVYRFTPGMSAPSHYDDFRIPYSKGLTVLDGLIYVYENIDSSLAFRWSCKNVQCGTCGMLVNGEPVLACERKIEIGETVRVDPFPIPVIKDVVTDLSSIEDKRVRVFSKLTQPGRPESLSPEEVNPLISLHKCLDCHVCDVICPLNKGKTRIEPESFLPADLVQLASLLANRREGQDRREEAYAKKVYECLTCGACVKARPVDIDIIRDAVERLRQDFMKRDGEPYRKLFSPKDWVERWVELRGQPFLLEAREEYRVSNTKGTVAFFVGCIMNRREQDLASLTIRLLNKAQFDVMVPKSQTCCGQPLARMGMTEEARELLRKNVSFLEATGATRVVTACPDCSFAFREDYGRLIGDGGRKPRFEVFDLVSLLPEATTGETKKIACHNPCYLSRQGIHLSDELRRKGISMEEIVEGCCGAGGGVYFTNPTLGQEIRRTTAAGVKSNVVVTGCPYCKEQFERVFDKKKVIHYVELFDQ